MNTHSILNYMEILFLSLALLLMIIFVAKEFNRGRINLNHYSLFFLFFLSGWIIIELIDHQSLFNFKTERYFIDFVFILILAIWLNLRFFWALKSTRSEKL